MPPDALPDIAYLNPVLGDQSYLLYHCCHYLDHRTPLTCSSGMKRSSTRLSCLGSIAGSSASLRPNLCSRIPSRWVCQKCSSRIQARQNDRQSRQVSILNRLNTPPSRSLNASTFSKSLAVATQRRAASDTTNDGQATVREDLPSQKEGRRSHVAKRFSHVMDHLQSNIFIAGQRLNDLTGYSGIEALKRDIEEQGQSQCRNE